MSILEQEEQRKAQAEKARAFDQIQADRRSQQVYDSGLQDGSDATRQAVAQRIAQHNERARLLDLQDTAKNYGLSPEWVSLVNSLTNKPDSFPLTADDLNMIAPGRNPEALIREAEALRSKSGGPLSFDDLGALSRQTSDDAYIDITPQAPGLAETYRGQ